MRLQFRTRTLNGCMMGPRRILLAYLVLFGFAVPWYWQYIPIDDEALMFGMPVWAFCATIGSLVISLFSGWILLRRWPCEETDDPADGKDPVS